MKGHVFRGNVGGEAGCWQSWCWRQFDTKRGEHSVLPEEADCMHCVRARRDNALWKAQHYAELARDATERLESLRRARSRRTTSRRTA